MMPSWKTFVDRIRKGRPEWTRGPYITSATHALITVLGLMPYPFGPVGMVFLVTGNGPWVWLAASTWTCAWYWVREYKQTGLRPKSKEGHTWGQRWDTWMDAIFPTVALGAMWWWLWSAG